jgi:hypothetical protein
MCAFTSLVSGVNLVFDLIVATEYKGYSDPTYIVLRLKEAIQS